MASPSSVLSPIEILLSRRSIPLIFDPVFPLARADLPPRAEAGEDWISRSQVILCTHDLKSLHRTFRGIQRALTPSRHRILVGDLMGEK